MSKKKKTTGAAVPEMIPANERAATDRGESNFSFFDNPWLPLLVLLAATAATYFASLGNGFVTFDDDKSIWYNQQIKHPSLIGIFKGQSLGMYAPVTILGYTAVYQLFGENASAFHSAGLLMHLLNVVLAYYLLLKIQPRRWAAFFVALLFGVHPIMVEPVSWVSGLSTPIFSFFYLISLHFCLDYLDGKGKKYYWLALLLFLVAGLAKSAAATLPLMFVALDWWRNGKLTASTFLNKWPFWLLSIGLIGFTFITREAEGHNVGSAVAFSFVDRIFMVSQTLFFYPFKLLAPLHFSIAYPFAKTDGLWRADYYLALPALALLGWWIIKNWNRQQEIILALGMYVLPLCLMLPVVSVGTFEMRSDRYAYLPSLGIFFLLMLLLEKIKQPALRYGLLSAFALLLAFQTMKQTRVWSDGTALFKNCVDKTPDAALCQCNLGYSELLAEKFDASIEHYSNALELDKTYVEAYNGRGQAYLNVNKIPEALADFTKAIEAGIVTPKLFFNRGKCLAMMSRFSEAIPDLTRSTELEPKSPETWYFRAFCYEKTASPDNAMRDYGKAIELNPNYVEALVNRGLMHYTAQQYPQAIADNTKALGISSGGIKPMVLVNRANAYMQSGQLNEALADANNAIELNANYPRAYQSRAAIYMKMGQPDKAQADMKKAGQ